jgi:putative oxidoreductase
MKFLSRYSETIYCIMRVVVGLLFACHGGQKLLGFPPGGHGAGAGMMLVGAWIELVAGFMIAFGLLTPIAALLAAGEMAVAYFKFHAPGGFFPIVNKGEPAVIYCFIFLYIAARGAGRWSVDAMMSRGRGAPDTIPVR